MSARGVQTQLTEEQARESRELGQQAINADACSPVGDPTLTLLGKAGHALVALADAYLSLKERLMVAWSEDEYFQDRERLLNTLREIKVLADARVADGRPAYVDLIEIANKARAAVSVGSPETRGE